VIIIRPIGSPEPSTGKGAMPAGSTRTNHTRADLLAAAAVIFERDGYARAKASDICRAAGVTKGALYFYFSSKKALAAEVLNLQTQEWSRARRQLSVARHSPLQVLVDLGYAVSLRAGPDLTTAGAHRLLFQSPLCEELAGQQIDQWVGVVHDLLLAAESEGELYPDLDLRQAAEAVVTALIGMRVASIAMTDFDDVTRRAATVWRMWIPALAPPEVRRTLRLQPPSSHNH
jgi:AcrR family transcriptional regulator